VKIIFFGTPYFAKEILDFLFAKKVQILAVVTQPDRPKGRSLQCSPSPVKELVLEKRPELEVLQPLKVSEEWFLERLKKLGADLYVVVAFGQILPQKLLDIPPLGCINVHASLLPKYRGAAPMQRCLMQGEKATGVAIQKMVLKMDAGDVLAVSKTAVPIDMTFGELEKILIALTKPLLLDIVRRYEEGIPEATPQDHSLATYAPKIEPEQTLIQWDQSNLEVHNQIRALSPRPGAWCYCQVGEERKRVKILSAALSVEEIPLKQLKGRKIGCKHGSIELLEVQPEGKKKMNAPDWLRGQKKILFM